MASLNKLSALITTGNTGVGNVSFDPKNIIGALLCPKGFELDVTNLQTNLLAAVQHVSRLARIYPLHNFINTNEATEEKVVQTFNTGAKKPVREGFNDWTFQYADGALTLHQKVRKFNGGGWDYIFYDGEMRLMGINGSTATKIKAIPSGGGFFWANPFKLNDGSKITEYMVQFAFPVRYLNDHVAFVKADFDIPDIVKGLQDVTLTVEDGGTAGTYHLIAETAIGENLAELYPTAFTNSLITAKNADTKAVCSIQTVTAGTTSTGTPCFVLALQTSDTDYSGATDIEFNLSTPAAMAAAGIESFESTGAVTIEKN